MNIVVFAISIVLVFCIAIPLFFINLDIVYSKVLGPIKQGVLQGVMQASGDAIQICGPLIVT